MIRVFCNLIFLVTVLMMLSCVKNTLGSRKALCVQRLSLPVESVEDVSNDEWVELVLSDLDKHYDCTGQPLRFAATPSTCEKSGGMGVPRFVPLRNDDVVARDQSTNFGFVWIPMQRFNNGDFGGPVTFVQTSRSLTVIGIGMLALPKDHVSLKMHTIRGKELLFAEGARCEGDSKKCDRVIRLLRLDRGHFVPIRTRDNVNDCQMDSDLDLYKAKDIRLRDGRVRRFELTTTYEIVPEGLEVHEQMVVTDRRFGASIARARQFRTSDATRLLEFNGTSFTSREDSLWTRTMATHGDVR